MGVVFDGQAWFESGPHRLAVGCRGRFLLYPLRAPNDAPVTIDSNLLELQILQTGRLVAPTRAGIWLQAAPIIQAAETAREGTLRDVGGHEWPGMAMVCFEPTGPIDVGRMVSLPYEVRYLRFG